MIIMTMKTTSSSTNTMARPTTAKTTGTTATTTTGLYHLIYRLHALLPRVQVRTEGGTRIRVHQKRHSRISRTRSRTLAIDVALRFISYPSLDHQGPQDTYHRRSQEAILEGRSTSILPCRTKRRNSSSVPLHNLRLEVCHRNCSGWRSMEVGKGRAERSFCWKVAR